MKKTIHTKMKSFIAFFFAISSISMGLVSAHPHFGEEQDFEQQQILDEELTTITVIDEIENTH